jgi:hypothetical protein
VAPRDYDPGDLDAPSVKLDRFMKAATDQLGTKCQFGAEARFDDPHPQAFDSSELVEWAAHQAGMPDMPDGSWNQYRYLHDQGATASFDEAMQTRGALVFGFSSDPLASSDRPAHAYVGISLGNGKVLDISERAGQVKVMDPGGFYTYGAKIPEFHAPDDTIPPDDPEDRVCYPDDGRPDGSADTPQVSNPDSPEDNVSSPTDDGTGPLSVDDVGAGSSTDLAYADDASSYDTGDAYAGAGNDDASYSDMSTSDV